MLPLFCGIRAKFLSILSIRMPCLQEQKGRCLVLDLGGRCKYIAERLRKISLDVQWYPAHTATFDHGKHGLMRRVASREEYDILFSESVAV